MKQSSRCLALVIPALILTACAVFANGYPRIANLWGCYPSSREYDMWSKYGLLVMGGTEASAWRLFAKEVKRRNPEIVLLSTAQLMNLSAPAQTPWFKDEWTLKRPDGGTIKWWADQIYTPNLLNDDCLNALVAQADKDCGEIVRDGTIAGVMCDSVVGSASWLGPVDTNGDGKADDPTQVDPAWHDRQCRFFDQLRAKWGKCLFLANDADDGHAPHINGRLFEGGTLFDRVADGSLAAGDAISRLNTWMANSAQPGITFVTMTHPLGWQGWRVGNGDKVSTPGEVDRVRRDFRRMRLGLAMSLMTDAYYFYDFGTVWYGNPKYWYAEYEAPLGKPLGPGREMHNVAPVTVFEWSAGQKTDAFILNSTNRVTPQGLEAELPQGSAGWNRIIGTNPKKVIIEPGRTYRIEADCEVLRKASSTYQFNVRTGVGGWEHHDKGVETHVGVNGETWHTGVTVVPDNFDDYAVEWHLCGSGALRLRHLKITRVDDGYFVREFEGGTAVLNPNQRPITIDLGRNMRRMLDKDAPKHAIEVDDDSPDCAVDGAWEIKGGEDHYYGVGYRAARKPGECVRWSFTSPSADTYTLYACIPGGKSLTDAAVYTLPGMKSGPTATINQRKADGGWVRLFDVKLAMGQRCEVSLRSSGVGITAADAIRVESKARFNDGSRLKSVTLDPLDGTILIR